MTEEQENIITRGLFFLGEMVALKTGANPCENNASQFKNDTFSMRSFYWGDDETISNFPNFKYKDVEVRWYKYLGRGMEVNQDLTPTKWAAIFEDCLKSLT